MTHPTQAGPRRSPSGEPTPLSRRRKAGKRHTVSIEELQRMVRESTLQPKVCPPGWPASWRCEPEPSGSIHGRDSCGHERRIPGGVA
jgi:hypothetical protein